MGREIVSKNGTFFTTPICDASRLPIPMNDFSLSQHLIGGYRRMFYGLKISLAKIENYIWLRVKKKAGLFYPETITSDYGMEA